MHISYVKDCRQHASSSPRLVWREAAFSFPPEGGNLPFLAYPFGALGCAIFHQPYPSPLDYRLRYSTSTASHDHKFISTHSSPGLPLGISRSSYWPNSPLNIYVVRNSVTLLDRGIMNSASLPAAAVGNGRLLVSIDEWGDILSSCWPCIDSPNQLPIFRSTKTSSNEGYASDGALEPRFGYVRDTNAFSTVTPGGTSIQDTVVDIPLAKYGNHRRRACLLYCRFPPSIDSTSDPQQLWLNI
jgi:hypothetical protein